MVQNPGGTEKNESLKNRAKSPKIDTCIENNRETNRPAHAFRRLLVLLPLVAAVVFIVAISVLFPKSYEREIIRAANMSGADPALVAAVARVESGFDPSAISPRGAVGLMQLMPATARQCAEKMGERYSDEMLLSPDYNLQVGAYYLMYLLARFGDETTALAAYNAGEGNVSAWLDNKKN